MYIYSYITKLNNIESCLKKYKIMVFNIYVN